MKLENKGDLSFFAKQDDLVSVFVHFKFLFDVCLESHSMQLLFGGNIVAVESFTLTWYHDDKLYPYD